VTSSDSPVGTVVVVVDDAYTLRPSGMLAVRIAFGPESTGDEQALARSTMPIRVITDNNRRTGLTSQAP
jgi:hypothetical protein